jgi:hypothetical protein
VSLAEFGLGETQFVSAVDSLHVDGSNAWVGAMIVHSSQPDVSVAGDPAIVMAFDRGVRPTGRGRPPGADPAARPALGWRAGHVAVILRSIMTGW